MPTSAIVNIREIDLTAIAQSKGKFVYGFSGVTKRGDVNNPFLILSSWEQFERRFGGFIAGNDFAVEVQRAFERGARLRINRIVNYSNINTPSSITAQTAQLKGSWTFGSTTVLTNTTYPNAVVVNFSGGSPATLTSNVLFTGSHNETMEAIAQDLRVKGAGIFAKVSTVKSTTPGGLIYNIILTPVAGVTISGITYTTNAGQGGAGTSTNTGVNTQTIQNSTGASLFSIDPLAPGADYNNLLVELNSPSNNTLGYFDLTITHLTEGHTVERYKNLYLVRDNRLSAQLGLAPLLESNLIRLTGISPLAGLSTAALTPVSGIYGFSGGTNGAAVTNADYIGSNGATKLGWYAFSPYEDINVLCAPTVPTSTAFTPVHMAGSTYADSRRDLVYLMVMTMTTTTSSGLIAERLNTGIDSSYAAFVGGNLDVPDPTTAISNYIPGAGDFVGLLTNTHKNFGYHYSPAGSNRGIVKNANGPVTNFGAAAQYPELNDLANAQINMFVKKNNITQLSGQFTAQVKTSALSYLSTRFLLIDMKRTLKPYLEGFLDELNDPITWKLMYLGAKPYLDSLADARALYGKEGEGWSWLGDQFVSSLDDLKINKATDVQNGKYKILLPLKTVASLQEIDFGIILTPAGISFTEAASLV